MASYELGYWQSDLVIEICQGLSRWVGQQVSISELAQNFYLLRRWRAVGCGGHEEHQLEVGSDFVVALHGN
jgi:hypothetical protein